MAWESLRKFVPFAAAAVDTRADSVSDITSSTVLLGVIHFEHLKGYQLVCCMLGGIGAWAGEAALNC